MRSKKQELAQTRNWNRAQIKGACGTLRHLAQQVGRSGIERQLFNFEEILLREHDIRWNRLKEKL